MPNPWLNKSVSILSDDVGCARRINARNVTIRDTGDARGRGVFAARDFLAGDAVIIGLLDRREERRTAYSIQMDWNFHALFQEPANLTNHCCDPNLAIVPNRFGAYDFVAIRELSPGVELTWDYATSEFESIAVPVCLCSAADCRQTVGGFSTLPPENALVSAGFYAPYLKQNAGPFPRGIGMFSRFVGS
ncbi:SET domain-containing protein-lysine N-methyltransferase [Mesorhizobium salmacidum]|uniref:SET domain-containing protein-lysine N-methyltransferase n=1 Tax=Mesorhizobium salmacidum TaxID=3015171 RepID=UPI0039F57689